MPDSPVAASIVQRIAGDASVAIPRISLSNPVQPMPSDSERRAFLLAAGSVALTPFLRPVIAQGQFAAHVHIAAPHPTPRPGITAAKLPTREQLAHTPGAIAVFDLVRGIPAIVDGIRCHCGCAELKEFYSLLSCFETTEAMAMHCEVCQAHARLVHRLHSAGRSLDQIRKGVDARFG